MLILFMEPWGLAPTLCFSAEGAQKYIELALGGLFGVLGSLTWALPNKLFVIG